MDTKECIEVKDNLFVPFQWKDETPGGSNLGHAEFQVCLNYRRWKLKEFWVTPRQQRRNEVWHCKASEYNDFHISSYEGLQTPGAWLFYPCEEHRGLSFVLYVPAYSQYLEINPSGLSFWVHNYSVKPFTKIAEMLNKVSVTMNTEEDKILREKLVSLDGEK